jgi:hypothetical protein
MVISFKLYVALKCVQFFSVGDHEPDYTYGQYGLFAVSK